MNARSSSRLFFHRVYYSLPFVILGIWLLGAFETAINYDNLFLLESARRMMDGQRMSEAYFDTNPPWSIIQYLPMVFFERSGLFPAPYTVYTYTLLWVLIFAVALYRLLNFYPDITQAQKIIFVFCFLLANTIMVGWREFYFGERDQFIFMGLLILVLYQDLITRKPEGFKVGISGIFTMAICTFFILLKPHYLIIPSLIGLYRWYKTRRFFNTLLSPDALTIAAMIAIYIASLFIFFQDFIDIILPLSLKIYISAHIDQTNILTFIFGAILFLLITLCFISGLPLKSYKHSFILFVLSALCLLLFWLQGKGLYYQLLPMIGFCTLGAGLLLYNSAHYYFKKPHIFAPIIMFIMFGLTLNVTQGITVPKHAAYKEMPLIKELANCKNECSYYMFSFNFDIVQQIGYYNGMRHISRFPNLWWYPYLLENPDAEWGDHIFELYYSDFLQKNPNYLILIEPIIINGHKVDIYEILTRTPEMKNFMNGYEFVKTSNLKANDYLGNFDPTLNYDYSIYKKSKN